MSSMPIVDEDGKIVVKTGSLTPDESDNPVYKARNDVALPASSWLYGPERGHNLTRFQNAKQSPSSAQEFEKEAVFYLKDYGPSVAKRFIKRGEASFSINITKETINNG